MPLPPRRRAATTALAVALVVLGAHRLAPAPEPAAAAVGHVAGYRATVDGFTSWYGSYDLGAIGTAWCVDHGIRAPDPDLAYVPTALPGTADDVRAALAWAVGRHGVAPDRVTSAALMLAAHDLMGATYPSGRLDLGRLGPDRLAGFGGDEAAVLERARAIAAEARQRAHLRPPWVLELVGDDPVPGAGGTLVARLTAGGVPVAGIDLRITTAGSAALEPGAEGPATTVLTDADGTARVGFVAGTGPYQLLADATLPDLQLQAFAPTAARAQRVARAAVVEVAAALDRVGVAPTTTTLPPTTLPPTTATTSTTTSTTLAPTTTTTTSTTTSTTLAPTTTTTSTVPVQPAAVPTPTSAVVAPPPTPRTLPRTGADPLALGCIGSGLVLVGSTIRPRRRAAAA